MRCLRAAGTLLAVVIGVLLAVAQPAAAHNELKSSDPKSGATLEQTPAAVMLTFTQALIPGQTTVTVTGPDGASAAAGPAQLNGAVATVPLKPTVAGSYTVAYRVVAADGDVTDKSFRFTLTAAAIPAPTTTTTTTTSTTATATSQAAAPAAATSSGTTWWPWAVGALVLILIVVLALLLRRRRAGQSGPASS